MQQKTENRGVKNARLGFSKVLEFFETGVKSVSSSLVFPSDCFLSRLFSNTSEAIMCFLGSGSGAFYVNY